MVVVYRHHAPFVDNTPAAGRPSTYRARRQPFPGSGSTGHTAARWSSTTVQSAVTSSRQSRSASATSAPSRSTSSPTDRWKSTSSDGGSPNSEACGV